MRFGTSPRATLALAAIAFATAGCSNSGRDVAPTVAEPATTSIPTDTSVADELDQRFDLPPTARASSGGGDPRPPSYWALWNSCAPDNRAEEAAANGGRAAGWVLVDNILADPGVALGEHVLTSCEESVAILQGRTGAGEESDDPVYDLAAGLLGAELNLGVGAETCPAAEEAVIGAHIVLAAVSFDGISASPLDTEAGGALPDLIALLAAYNSGELCR